MIKILIIAIFLLGTSIADESSCGDWLPFKDEKCFKILDSLPLTYEEAQKSCSILEGAPTLAIVHTQEEQDFLVNYLFKTSKKVNNFWLGAKFTGNGFKWIDNSEFKYNNWDATKGPRNKAGYCVQLLADEASVGKWIDEPCERNNAVVCQKLQKWSSEKLQKTLLDTMKVTRDAFLDANKKIESQKQEIDDLKHQQEEYKKNPVPIGFTYVQLPKQQDPKAIWPSVEWSDVTSEYAGLFFRAGSGGGAAEFGEIQNENAPRVTKLRYLGPFDVRPADDWNNSAAVLDDWSSGIGAFAGSWDLKVGFTHQFYTTGGEVRPRNMAMRVWKRVK